MQYKSVAQTRGKHLSCPLCGSMDVLIFRGKGRDHDSFKCPKCALFGTKTALLMTTKLPCCGECGYGMFKKPFPQQRGVYMIWFFECRTAGCRRAAKTIDTLTIYAGYEKQAFAARNIERAKQNKGFEDAKAASIAQIECKLKKEKDGK